MTRQEQRSIKKDKNRLLMSGHQSEGRKGGRNQQMWYKWNSLAYLRKQKPCFVN